MEAELGDDIVDNDYEGACRASDLDGASAEKRHDEAAYDGRDKADGRVDARGDTEGDGQREGDDAYHYAGYDVGLEAFGVIILETGEEFGVKIDS